MGDAAPDIHQPIRVAIGQRAEQHPVDNGEDRARGSDAERQGEHGERREERSPAGKAERMPDVGAKRLPEHVVSPGRLVQMRLMGGPERPALDRGPALEETRDQRGSRVAAQHAKYRVRPGEQRRAKVGAHLRCEALAEGARERAEDHASVKPLGGADVAGSRGDLQQASCPSRLELVGKPARFGPRHGNPALAEAVIATALVVFSRPLSQLLDERLLQQTSERAVKGAGMQRHRARRTGRSPPA